MTPKEFKAWFDGFTEEISGLPSEKQWDRIKARVAEIDGGLIGWAGQRESAQQGLNEDWTQRYKAQAP